MMTKKVNEPSNGAVPPKRDLPVGAPALLSHEERLQRIEALGERIGAYIRYMCEVGGLANASGEAKEKAIAAFYERMLVVEKQLARIHDEFRLE